MAKQQLPFPVPSGGGGALKKIVGLVFGLAVVSMVVKQPTASAEMVEDLFSMLGAAVDGMTTFLSGLGT